MRLVRPFCRYADGRNGFPPEINRAFSPAVRHDAAMNFNKNIGMLLLAVYLIVVGIIGLTGMGAGILLPILALVAGIFILIGK
jgi:hypothetical protein